MDNKPLAKKSLGQHWLSDSATLRAICDAGEIEPNDTVLEIGPGTGTLTIHLLATGANIIAIEKDQKLASTLCERINLSQMSGVNREKVSKNNHVKGSTSHKLRVVEGDVLEFDLTELPADYKVVANIPYYLTSKLIRVLSETSNQASRVVLLVQKEVAERVTAQPGQMSLLAVSAQFYWQVELGEVVPARLFVPPPKVDSQVLIMTRRAEPLFVGVDPKLYFRVVKAGFAARRKTLLNSLAGGLRTDKEQIQKVLELAQLTPTLRPQNLSLKDWRDLTDICQQQKLL